MRIRVLGGGWYGCHIALSLLTAGHEVELCEIAGHLFAGASGGNPARLHLGFHYPRSKLTRAMCQETHARFMGQYGSLTRTIPINIYAIAADDSMIDFGTYRQLLRGEVDYINLERPDELGLANVEGALLTGERHIVIAQAREYFEKRLGPHIRFGVQPQTLIDAGFDWTIDCTFCALDGVRIDRYEPCVTGLMEGPTDKAVTIMDGPFPSLYPWDESSGLNSLTSALHTPITRCENYVQAHLVLTHLSVAQVTDRIDRMIVQLAHYWPESRELYANVDAKLTIRAMPLSGSAARLVDVVRVGERRLRIRAGKIDAIMHAEDLVKEAICSA